MAFCCDGLRHGAPDRPEVTRSGRHGAGRPSRKKVQIKKGADLADEHADDPSRLARHQLRQARP